MYCSGWKEIADEWMKTTENIIVAASAGMVLCQSSYLSLFLKILFFSYALFFMSHLPCQILFHLQFQMMKMDSLHPTWWVGLSADPNDFNRNISGSLQICVEFGIFLNVLEAEIYHITWSWKKLGFFHYQLIFQLPAHWGRYQPWIWKGDYG